MQVAKDSLQEIYIGLAFTGWWDFREDDDTPIDLSGKTYTAKMKNIDEKYNSRDAIEIGSVSVHPDDVIGRIELTLTEEDTKKFEIPKNENNKYFHNNIYSKILIIDENDFPLLDIAIAPLKV